MRIVIVGTCGCGKTTLGKALSKKLNIPFVDLDDLVWDQNWVMREHADFEARLEKELQKEAFIFAGNHTRIKERIWSFADYVIWLDFPLPLLIYRVIKRSIRQIVCKERLCNGNLETWGRLLGKNSIVIWTLKSYFRRRRKYLPIFNQGGKYIHIKTKKDLSKIDSLLSPTTA